MDWAHAEETVVAIAYNDDGSEHDKLYAWETGQTYSNQGYRVVAIANDGQMTIEQAQALYDHERELASDYFGPGVRDWS